MADGEDTPAPAADPCAKPKRPRRKVNIPEACRKALSECMKGVKKGRSAAKVCFVDFNKCRRPV